MLTFTIVVLFLCAVIFLGSAFMQESGDFISVLICVCLFLLCLVPALYWIIK